MIRVKYEPFDAQPVYHSRMHLCPVITPGSRLSYTKDCSPCRPMIRNRKVFTQFLRLENYVNPVEILHEQTETKRLPDKGTAYV